MQALACDPPAVQTATIVEIHSTKRRCIDRLNLAEIIGLQEELIRLASLNQDWATVEETTTKLAANRRAYNNL